MTAVDQFPAVDFMGMARRQQTCQSIQLAKFSPSLVLPLVDVQGEQLL